LIPIKNGQIQVNKTDGDIAIKDSSIVQLKQPSKTPPQTPTTKQSTNNNLKNLFLGIWISVLVLIAILQILFSNKRLTYLVKDNGIKNLITYIDFEKPIIDIRT